MPFFGFLLIIIAIWIFFNVFNGNLIDVVLGKAQFNFNALGAPTTSASTNTSVDIAGTLKNIKGQPNPS